MRRAGLPVFLRIAGRPVLLLGDGAAAEAKRRLLERVGAEVVGEEAQARLAIVALEGEAAGEAAERLRGRGLLVNVVDRPELCDFTLPAIVDRDPVVVAIGTGGVSAGLAAALRQRLEALLPAGLGRVADALHAARDTLRGRFPAAGERRRAIGALLAESGPIDPLREHADPFAALTVDAGHPHPSGASRLPPSPIGRGKGPAAECGGKGEGERIGIAIISPDPDELTLRAARLLAQADRVIHPADMPPAILDRARADAERIVAPAAPAEGLTVELVWRRP